MLAGQHLDEQFGRHLQHAIGGAGLAGSQVAGRRGERDRPLLVVAVTASVCLFLLVFELVRGPLFSRMHELAPHLKIPKKGYASLQLARQLAKDSSVSSQEKARRLCHQMPRKS